MNPTISTVALGALLAGLGPIQLTQDSREAASPGTGVVAPRSLAFGDFDGDRLLDALAIGPEGSLHLLRNRGDGAFDDVSALTGLAAVRGASLVLWEDYDGDRGLDLLVGTSCGPRHLFRNLGDGTFEDVAERTGLAGAGCDLAARWFDYDRDGRLDLHLESAAGARLYHALADGRFEELELPVEGSAVGGALLGGLVADAGETGALLDPPAAGLGDAPDLLDNAGPSGVLPLLPGSPGPRAGMTTPLVVGAHCANSIRDQASPGTCLEASTTPTLGSLYPLSSNLFVAPSGDVGIGTTSPSAKLHVAGTARITNTLTLAPAVDTALDVSTGSIYKGGALFIHTKNGSSNTALGREALANVTSGTINTAAGFRALYSNTTGLRNTAAGYRALSSNTTGLQNTAAGARALQSNTTGFNNTATGYRALQASTGNLNTACGSQALGSNTTGSYNTATGSMALFASTTGDFNTVSGHEALSSNTTGAGNTASGARVLRSNTTGSYNTASGYRTLFANTTGDSNTATGFKALPSNTTGFRNTAIGRAALQQNTTGYRNIAIGQYAGSALTTGSDNIAIGNSGVAGESATIRIGTSLTHTRAFIAGIRGVTTGVANAIPVLVDSAGQLGTVSSSRRFKEEVRDMGDATERLLGLRPVTFRYKPEVQGGERPLEYGLIAEEVAEVFPDLVVYDEEGQPFTVKYHLLSSMLLNELKEQARELRERRERLAALESAAHGGPPPAQFR
jgi:hypothetical protein